MPTSSAPRLGALALLFTRSSLVSAMPIRDGPSVLARHATEAASAAVSRLQKRAIMKGDNYVPLGNTKLPLTPLLLVFCGLGAAVVCIFIILLKLLGPSCMSRNARIVMQEREQAKQDLRLKGANSPRNSPRLDSPNSTSGISHPRRFPPNKQARRVGQSSRGSMTPSEAHTAVDHRTFHGYRGTSFSLSEARKNSDKSHRSSLLALSLPLLNSNDSSSGSSTLHLDNKDVGMAERARYPITVANDFSGRSRGTSNANNPRLSFGTKHLARTSSTGKGADLQRTRSGKRDAPVHVHPQTVQRAHAQYRDSRIEPSPHHPLHPSSHANQNQHAFGFSRHDSTLSMYDAGSSAEHSCHDGSTVASRGGSFVASGNPLQPLTAPGFGAAAHASQPWASPASVSRSSSPEFLTAASPRFARPAGFYDSDGSDVGAPAAPRTDFRRSPFQ